MAVTDALNAIVSYLDVLSQNRVHQFASFAAFSLCGALFFACISCIIETATHHAYLFLERQGLIRRLVPETPNTVTHYKLATFKTFVGSLFPVILVLCYVYKPLLAAAKPDWNPLRFMPFVYLQVIIHDAWFWAVHHVMHRYHNASTAAAHAIYLDIDVLCRYQLKRWYSCKFARDRNSAWSMCYSQSILLKMLLP